MQQWILPTKRILTTIIKAEMNFVLRKKTLKMKKRSLFFVKFSVKNYLHALKLVLNKSMRAPDNKQAAALKKSCTKKLLQENTHNRPC